METEYSQLITQIYIALETGDTTLIAPRLAEDMLWSIVGKEPFPGKGEFLKCCVHPPFKAGSLKLTVNQVLIDSNRAAVEGTTEAETPAGKPYRHHFCDLFLFEGGQVKKLTTYFDTQYVKENLR